MTEVQTPHEQQLKASFIPDEKLLVTCYTTKYDTVRVERLSTIPEGDKTIDANMYMKQIEHFTDESFIVSFIIQILIELTRII